MLAIFSLILFLEASSQDYTSLQFSAITSNDGLPSIECNFVYQDIDEFLWIGTNEGLYRFDGYSLKGFDLLVNYPSKNLQFVNCAEDKDGNMAFGTSNGIIVYSRTTNEITVIKPWERLQSTIINNKFPSITYDQKGRLWFGNSEGLFLFDAVADTLIPFSQEISVKDIVYSKNGDIWIAIGLRGLAKVNAKDSTLNHFKLFNNDFKKGIYSLFEGSDNILWAGTWDNGLYAFDISQPDQPVIKKSFRHSPDNPNTISGDIIFDMATDNYGNLWVGSPYGLSIMQDPLSEDVSVFNYKYSKGHNSLTNNEIRSIIKDRTGVMWMATEGGGVNKVDIHKNKFKPYAITEVDPQKKSQTIQAFTFDRENELLIGVKSLGFGSYDIEQELFVHFEDIPQYAPLKDIKINTVKNFTWDSDSSLWLGTRYKGLIKYDVETKDYLRLKNLKGNRKLRAKEIFSVKDGLNNDLWVVANSGLYKILPGTTKAFDDFSVEKIPLLEGKYISDIAFDKSGRLWIATYKGDLLKSQEPVNNYEKDIPFVYVNKAQTGAGISINALFFDSADNLWLGSGGDGLKILDQVSGKFICHKKKMEGVIIYDITEDAKGNILATSNNGLVHLKKEKKSYEISLLTARNGLQSNVFIKGALFHDQEKHLFIGGHNGFNYFNPLLLKQDTIAPNMVFTDLKTSKKRFNPNAFNKENPFIINYDDNLFTISFSSLDLRDPDYIKYAYKLEGLDEDWQSVTANSRTATYVNLKPGNYTFKLLSTNAMGKWNEEAATLPIKVRTAPYLTWWAYSIYVTLISGIILILFLMYKKQMQAKQELKLEHMERTKSEKLNKFKLQFFTNLSHELLTPLSILLILSERWSKHGKIPMENIPKIFERNVNKLHHHIKQMLQFRKAESGNMKLDIREDDLSPVVNEIVENYLLIAAEKNISFDSEIPDKLTGYYDKEKINISLNNLLSNAFKYTGKGGYINLKVSSFTREDHRWVEITVTDSGIGIPRENLENIFNRFYRLPSSHTHFEDGIGIGLALTKNLVDLHGGFIKVDSVAGKGTTFSIELPISLSYFNANTSECCELIDEAKIDYGPEERKIPEVANLKIERNFRKTILIVEDNDDFLTLVMMFLNRYYRIITCKNGEDALTIANNQEIDLIVSDLMIPKMDGHALCQAIKSTVNTSHIPFIILTARTNDHERLLGYESGVDSYLTKPVNMAVLISRIDSLLKKREVVHSDFNKGAFLEPEKIVTTSIDENILLRAKETVEDHISDPEFTVKVLCDQLAMSNSMLYRKIKGILDITPNDFIKNIRLRRAAQLMEDKNIHISEVAYQTGFNDLSYFGVCFKKQYGVTPTVYQKELEVKYNDLKTITDL